MATLISFSGVIATDTFAFLGGKVNNKAFFFLTSDNRPQAEFNNREVAGVW